MNRPINLKGRYVRTSSQNFVKIPTNLYGGCNTQTTKSMERYQRTHIGISSTCKPKEFIGESIEDKEILTGSSKEPIPEEVIEGQTLEVLNPPLVKKSNDTTLSLLWDPKFVNLIDTAQVQALFGSSTNTVISQIETSTVEPTISVEPNKYTNDNSSYQRNISPPKKH